MTTAGGDGAPGRGGGAPGRGGGAAGRGSGAAGAGDYDPRFFAALAAVEHGHFWFEARNRLIVHEARRHFPERARYLEVGCGTGFVLAALARAFPRWSLDAFEIHEPAIALAATRTPRARFHHGDARRLDFHEAFDVVGAFDVIEHVEEHEDVARALFAALVPGGGLLLTVPQHPWLWSAVDEQALHKRRYTRATLRGVLEGAGFEVVRATSFVSLLLPVMLAARLLKRRAAPDPMAEFEISAGANRVLRAAMSLELAATTRGLSWPAGGSLLVVARRPGRQGRAAGPDERSRG